MFYVGLAVAAAVVVGLLYVVFHGPPADAEHVPSDAQIDVEKLRATLDHSGVDLSSTNIPDAEILRPYIAQTDEFLGAVQARRGNKRAILVALDDRLVAGEATLGTMGAEVFTFRWTDIESFDQTFEVGGQLDFAVGDTSYTYSHLPRSQTQNFSKLVRRNLPSNETGPGSSRPSEAG